MLRSRCQGVPSNLFDLEEAIILPALRFLSLRLMVATTLPLSDSDKRLEPGVSKYGVRDVQDGHAVYTWPSAHGHLSLHSRFSWKHCTKGTWTPTSSIFRTSHNLLGLHPRVDIWDFQVEGYLYFSRNFWLFGVDFVCLFICLLVLFRQTESHYIAQADLKLSSFSLGPSRARTTGLCHTLHSSKIFEKTAQKKKMRIMRNEDAQ